MVPRLARALPLARACSSNLFPAAARPRAPPIIGLRLAAAAAASAPPASFARRRGSVAAMASAAGGPSASSSDPITYLSQRQAAALDEDLMNPDTYGFSLDQLMELAGLSVACAVRDAFPPSSPSPSPTAPPRVLVLAGPGNNGGDGLVAARHLTHFGYRVTVCYPKPTDRPIFKGLVTQLRALGVPVWGADELVAAATKAAAETAASGGGAKTTTTTPTPSALPSLRPLFDVAIDAVFGFSYSGGAPRAPFAEPLALLSPAADPPPVVAVDLPSGWHVEKGDEGGLGGGVPGLRPDVLVSLTAPKLAARKFEGSRHYVGGRFVPPGIAEKYGLRLPPYRGSEQIVLVSPPPPDAATEAASPPTLLDPASGPAEVPPAGDAEVEASDLAAAAAAMRISYTRGELLEREVLAPGGAGGDPMLLFAEWFAAAAAEPGVVEPNAVCLATSDPETGAPSARMVLLKNFTPSSLPSSGAASSSDLLPPPPLGGSFVVYTNLESRKGRELFPSGSEAAGAAGAQSCPPRPAALTFYWEPLQRSVRIEGVAERVSEAEAAAYFASRPRGSQIGAWASLQSRVCEGGREGLEKAEREAEARFAGGPVPKPPHWGGVRVRPLRVEFWQGRPSRLHDRLVFERAGADEPWGGGAGGGGAAVPVLLKRLYP